jgi:hypothetical protein
MRDMHRLPTVFASCAVVAATLVGGCSDNRVTTPGPITAAPGPGLQHAASTAKAPIGDSFATAALDDRSLSVIRGGLSTGSGLTLNFSFEEATFINHQLTQSIVVPTVTVSPGSNTAVVGNTSSGLTPSAIAPAGSGVAQAQVASPALSVQSIINQGMTSVVSSLGGGGFTNTISNAANNQLIQQVITANINVTGLSQTVQQSVAATVLSRVAAANAQFR